MSKKNNKFKDTGLGTFLGRTVQTHRCLNLLLVKLSRLKIVVLPGAPKFHLALDATATRHGFLRGSYAQAILSSQLR